MKFSKILAVCLVALMTLAIFAACETGNEGDQSTEQTTQAPTENTTDSTVTTEPETTAPGEDTTEPGQDTTEPGQDTTEPGEDTTAPGEDSSEPGEDEIKTITIAEALELCGDEGNVTEERYYIRATIVSITNAAYGAMIIADQTGEIPVYGTYSEDGSINYSEMAEKPYKGDEVLLYCILQNYNGTKEVKNARLIEFTHVEVEIDPNEYTDMSVADAREADKGTKIKVDGVVAKITYANGFKPNGLFLVDQTGSIYVFDGDLAQRVSEGDKITVAGEKDYWILDTEQGFAASFGYKGSCQLASAHLLEQDDSQDYAFDKSWITSTTVKDMLHTPVSENITTTIYKVNALVKKVPGNGFVNYYFFDIDGETGNYTYSQCNGNDFDWLDEFDGKICTVYISPINCKSTAGDCFFRLVPIEVIDEGYTFNKAGAPAYALKYHAMGQFRPEYSADPALELLSSVSSELLGFSGVTLSYASSDDSIVSFVTADGKTVMHCNAPGTATVTVTATLGDASATDTFEITVNTPPQVEAGNVQSAIDAAKGETVTVKGIVGPSLVNKVGFYLIDETGVIAIQTTSEVMATLTIGDEVILSGVCHINIKDATTHCIGQTCINDAVILANNFGNHEYSTASFVTDKNLQFVYDLDPMVDYSTTVFVLKANVTVEETPYYTNIYLTDANGTQLRLYCSNAKQYNWLKVFDGQEVTVEVAACNWNDKDYYTGCVLSVVTEQGKIFNELNFSK